MRERKWFGRTALSTRRSRTGWGLRCAWPPVGASSPPSRTARANAPLGIYLRESRGVGPALDASAGPLAALDVGSASVMLTIAEGGWVMLPAAGEGGSGIGGPERRGGGGGSRCGPVEGTSS